MGKLEIRKIFAFMQTSGIEKIVKSLQWPLLSCIQYVNISLGNHLFAIFYLWHYDINRIMVKHVSHDQTDSMTSMQRLLKGKQQKRHCYDFFLRIVKTHLIGSKDKEI